jgi:hypothetical protein
MDMTLNCLVNVRTRERTVRIKCIAVSGIRMFYIALIFFIPYGLLHKMYRFKEVSILQAVPWLGLWVTVVILIFRGWCNNRIWVPSVKNLVLPAYFRPRNRPIVLLPGDEDDGSEYEALVELWLERITEVFGELHVPVPLFHQMSMGLNSGLRSVKQVCCRVNRGWLVIGGYPFCTFISRPRMLTVLPEWWFCVCFLFLHKTTGILSKAKHDYLLGDF